VSGQVHIVAAVPARRNPGTHGIRDCWLQSQYGWFWRRYSVLPPLEFKLQSVQPKACHHTTFAIQTPIAQLHNESCDFGTLYSWRISRFVKIYISNPLVWLLLQLCKVKVKCTLVQALKLCTGRTARRGSRAIALPFLDHGTRRGWRVSVMPRLLFTPGKDPVPIVQEAGWAPGPVRTGAENLASTRIQSPDRPARSQLLYQLRYPAHIPIVSMSTNLKLVTRGTFIQCPKPLMNYTRNIGDVESTHGWLCGKCLEHFLCLVLSLALFSMTEQFFCMHMTWGLATAIQSKLAKQLHGSFCCTRWKAGRKVCGVVYSERRWQPTIIQ